jgi:hypothetical protein
MAGTLAEEQSEPAAKAGTPVTGSFSEWKAADLEQL